MCIGEIQRCWEYVQRESGGALSAINHGSIPHTGTEWSDTQALSSRRAALQVSPAQSTGTLLKRVKGARAQRASPFLELTAGLSPKGLREGWGGVGWDGWGWERRKRGEKEKREGLESCFSGLARD